MKIRPISNNVVVEPVTEDKTPGGLLLPDTTKKKHRRGVVIAVGPGYYSQQTGKRDPMDVKVGDVVLFGEYAPAAVDVAGKAYLVIGETDVLAVLEDENPEN